MVVSFAALCDGLAARHPVRDRRDDWIALGAPDEMPIQVTHVAAQGAERIFVVADICAAVEVAPRDALEVAVKLLVGGVYVRHDILAVRIVLGAEQTAPTVVDAAIRNLRAAAEHYKTELMSRKSRTKQDFYDPHQF